MKMRFLGHHDNFWACGCRGLKTTYEQYGVNVVVNVELVQGYPESYVDPRCFKRVVNYYTYEL